jgi:hypothetical protein
LEITATSALNTTVTGTVAINDDELLDYLGKDLDTPITNNITSIKSDTGYIKNISDNLSRGNVIAKISEISRPSDLRSGKKTATNIVQQLHTNMQMKSGVTLKCIGNGNALVGNYGLMNNQDAGYLLEPGESIFIEVNNLNKIYIKTWSSDDSGGFPDIYYIGT